MSVGDLTAAQKLRLAALKEAADYHARLAATPTANGGASATKVTVTAETFVEFVTRVTEKAGLDESDLDDTESRSGKLG